MGGGTLFYIKGESAEPCSWSLLSSLPRSLIHDVQLKTVGKKNAATAGCLHQDTAIVAPVSSWTMIPMNSIGQYPLKIS